MTDIFIRDADWLITVDRDRGQVQSIEIPIPDNPAWRDFKLELRDVEPMDRTAWDGWVAAEVAKLGR